MTRPPWTSAGIRAELPPRLRDRLYALPERASRRPMPTALRRRLYRIPERRRGPWWQDTRVAIAACALVATLLGPLVPETRATTSRSLLAIGAGAVRAAEAPSHWLGQGSDWLRDHLDDQPDEGSST